METTTASDATTTTTTTDAVDAATISLNTCEFECPLCLKLLYDPTTSPCGHSFCRRCAYEFVAAATRKETEGLSSSSSLLLKCPICRTVLGRPTGTTSSDGRYHHHSPHYHDHSWIPSSSIALGRLLQATFPEAYAARAAEEAVMAVTNPLPRLLSAASTTSFITNEHGQPLLPLFVLESLLPGQRMALHVFEIRYRLLIQRAVAHHQRTFGMVGRRPLGGTTTNPDTAAIYANDDGIAHHGTLVEIVSCIEIPDGRFRVTIEGRSVFRIVSRELRDGYWEAVIEPRNDMESNESSNSLSLSSQQQQQQQLEQSETEQIPVANPNNNNDDGETNNTNVPDMDPPETGNHADTTNTHPSDTNEDNYDCPREIAEHVIQLYHKWEELVTKNNWQRHEHQMLDVKAILGPMPTADQPGAMAFWVAAAINPLPPLGVAREIRPAVLAATHRRQRLDTVQQALEESIDFVRYERGTVDLFGVARINLSHVFTAVCCLVVWWYLQGYIRQTVLNQFGLDTSMLGVFGLANSHFLQDSSSVIINGNPHAEL